MFKHHGLKLNVKCYYCEYEGVDDEYMKEHVNGPCSLRFFQEVKPVSFELEESPLTDENMFLSALLNKYLKEDKLANSTFDKDICHGYLFRINKNKT